MEKRSHLGMAGHYAAMSEFLYRGYNVAVPAVDIGDDVSVVEDQVGTMWRLQVKTSDAPEARRGTYQLSRRQLREIKANELFFMFMIRSVSRWRFVLIRRDKLAELRDAFEQAARSGKRGRCQEGGLVTAHGAAKLIAVVHSLAASWSPNPAWFDQFLRPPLGHLQADHIGRPHCDHLGYLHTDHLAHPVTGALADQPQRARPARRRVRAACRPPAGTRVRFRRLPVHEPRDLEPEGDGSRRRAPAAPAPRRPTTLDRSGVVRRAIARREMQHMPLFGRANRGGDVASLSMIRHHDAGRSRLRIFRGTNSKERAK